MYVVKTFERPYKKGKYKQENLLIQDDKFQEFLEKVYISEVRDAETDEFFGYSFTFNSSLRHTACRVVSILHHGKVLYTYCDDARGQITKEFKMRVKLVLDAKARKEHQVA